MTGEGIDGLGPTFCADCKTSPGTTIHGANHPICSHHREWLMDWWREHPERKIGWDGEWNQRVYGWYNEVNETQDNNGSPGDHNKPYTYRRPSELQARGEISMDGALKMHRLKEALFGKGLREEKP